MYLFFLILAILLSILLPITVVMAIDAHRKMKAAEKSLTNEITKIGLRTISKRGKGEE